jgi:hypothetical protein
MQLPVPRPAAYAATGNVPLAAGCLGVAARIHGLGDALALDVLRPEATDALGDARLADLVARDEPDFLGLSLYLWNGERSLHLAREVKRRSPWTIVLIGGPEVSVWPRFLDNGPGKTRREIPDRGCQLTAATRLASPENRGAVGS